MSADASQRVLAFPVVAMEQRIGASLSRAPGHNSGATHTDEDLLARLKNSEPDALVALFHSYSRLVFGIGCRILRDSGEAEDLVQEFFLRLCNKVHMFDSSKGSARTWMIMVAYRQATARRCYLARRSFYTGTDLSAFENAIQGDLNLEEHVATHLTGAQLVAALDQLNDKERSTLRFYFFEGCDLREIADLVGERLENVRHYYYRGLEHLRKSAAELGLRGKDRDKGKGN
jgi:RNA polymerase sigma-70 factor (ECF subfamily)